MTTTLTEATAGTILEATGSDAGGSRYLILCISEGRGSSGFYPRETLIEAANNKLIGAGTFAYLDHPAASELHERPERSVRDLAGVFTSDAVWSEEHKGLVAEMRVFAPYQPLIAEMKDVIGLSIRGDGEVEMREGQRTVTSLHHIESVDWVTRAGRGGKVLQLLESARPTTTHVAEARNVGQWVESHIHRDFTVMADDMAAEGRLSREERIALSSAIGDALAAFVSNLETNAPQLYQRDLWDEPAAPAVSEGAPAPSTNDTPKEGLVPELTEAEVTALRDSAARAEAAERQLAESNARIAAMEARDTARPVVAAKVAESKTLGARTQARLVESILGALPMVDGKLDDEALGKAIESAVTGAEAELADYRPITAAPIYGTYGSTVESGGAGTEGGTPITEAEYDKASASTFGRTVSGS